MTAATMPIVDGQLNSTEVFTMFNRVFNQFTLAYTQILMPVIKSGTHSSLIEFVFLGNLSKSLSQR
jgi:hypothetical protein